MKRIKTLIKAFTVTRQDPTKEIAAALNGLQDTLAKLDIPTRDLAIFNDICDDVLDLVKAQMKDKATAPN